MAIFNSLRLTFQIYAMKKLNKADIAQRGEIQHTLAEKAVMASVDSPFIAKLHFSFQNGKEKEKDKQKDLHFYSISRSFPIFSSL